MTGYALEDKLIIAITERAKQVDAFAAVNRTVEREVQAEWTRMIDAWLADLTKPNPYVLDKTGMWHRVIPARPD